ncbi:MAG: exonuclease domain-containing protein [Gaiellaceae bacterium]
MRRSEQDQCVSAPAATTGDWVVLDFETASTRGTPCQVAAIRMRGSEEVEVLTTLIFQPPDAFDAFNIALHGIDPRDVRGAPHWPEVKDELCRFIGENPCIAHYAPFDMGVIRDACDASSCPWPSINYGCSVSIARQVWPGFPSYSLFLLCEELGIRTDGGRHHEALFDVRLAAEIVRRALGERSADSLATLLAGLYMVFGEIRPDAWRPALLKLRAADLHPNAEADADSPFFEKTVAFTGELAMVRRQAWQLIAAAGGQPADGVTKKTDFLVCGYQDLYKLSAGETKSSKLRYAEQLRTEEQKIEIIGERDFFRMLNATVLH